MIGRRDPAEWFIVMDGYVAMSGTELTRVYFISFYFIATVFVLNLVIVVILDAAMAIIEQDMPNISGPSRLSDAEGGGEDGGSGGGTPKSEPGNFIHEAGTSIIHPLKS